MNLDFASNLWNQLNTAEKLALLGAVIVWLVYRADRWTTRRAVLDGVRRELTLHSAWVGTAYPGAMHGSWTDPSYLVYKLGTVAIDDAIVRGSSVLLNRELISSLVVYRQVVEHFNQLVDQAMAFQARPELWQQHPPQQLVDHMLTLIEAVHIVGIGDLTAQKSAHWHLKVTENEFNREWDSKVLPLIWAVTGINLLFLKRWGRWL